jgi:hypothetical protein
LLSAGQGCPACRWFCDEGRVRAPIQIKSFVAHAVDESP